jgi:hypothetical protein
MEKTATMMAMTRREETKKLRCGDGGDGVGGDDDDDDDGNEDGRECEEEGSGSSVVEQIGTFDPIGFDCFVVPSGEFVDDDNKADDEEETEVT